MIVSKKKSQSNLGRARALFYTAAAALRRWPQCGPATDSWSLPRPAGEPGPRPLSLKSLDWKS